MTWDTVIVVRLSNDDLEKMMENISFTIYFQEGIKGFYIVK